MNRSEQVRAVFAELRQKLDTSYTASELIQIAQLVVDSYHQVEIEGPDLNIPKIGPLSLFSQPVDKAMEDGGWRVLDFERRNGMSFYDDDSIDLRMRRRRRGT